MDAKKPARAPLGLLYEGRCAVGGAQITEACNFGYAAGRCEVFPPDALADAVRFTVLQGRTMYVLEKDHSPVQYGDACELHGTLARQAEVFRSWMNR
jgi:hypothetical protein